MPDLIGNKTDLPGSETERHRQSYRQPHAGWGTSVGAVTDPSGAAIGDTLAAALGDILAELRRIRLGLEVLTGERLDER